MKIALYTIVLTACASHTPPPASADQAGDPTPLLRPAQLTPDFSVQQHLEASSHGKSGAFDAVVQKRGGELVIVGLGPAGVRMFVLKQGAGAADDGITFEQSFGPQLPFPPRNILLDVHRVFFMGLSPAQRSAGAGTFEGETPAGKVREIWRAGELRERQFSRPDRQGAIIVSYGPGCRADRCAPDYVTLDNGWYGYVLRIENHDYEFFTDSGAGTR